MVFSSNIFLLFFLPIFLIAYFLSPKQIKNYTLLIFSLIFYAYGAPDFILFLLGECILNYFIVKLMNKSAKAVQKKLLCTLSIVLSLGMLLYFKYANFFMENLNAVLGCFHRPELGWAEIALPIGISFFTFQSITYTVDVYRKTTEASPKLSNYILYIVMFPQLIAGPIVRYNAVAEEILNRESTMENRVVGFYRFVIGLSKKVLIANVLAQAADSIFALEYGNMSTATAWIGMLAYTMQIYFDFSGYSDMAIGLGMMMGFHFPENFMNPYTSTSISDFWRKWHITLGAFMKEYLYIPLGGNRKSVVRTYINLGIVFLCSGFWHGAAWNFILWGAFHGFFIILDRLFMLNILKKIGRIPSMLLTFFVVNLGWVLFRVEGVSPIADYFTTLFGFQGGETIALDAHFWFIFAVALVFSFLTIFKFGQKIQDLVFAEHYTAKRTWIMLAIVVILFVLSVGALTVTDFNPFIYFRF